MPSRVKAQPRRGHGRIVASRFRPHPALRNAHLQTIFANLARPMPRLALREERLELPDGDFVVLGWCEKNPPSGPLALLIHGLGGGFDSKYKRGTAQQLIRRGIRCVLWQQRGAGPEPNRLPRSYHHGASDDLRAVIDELHRREPRTPLFAVGWSLGANVLLKYLGEQGARSPLAAAVAVSAPFLLRPCAERLRRGFSRVYQRRMLDELKRGMRRKFARSTPPFDMRRMVAARDFFEFDDLVTAPLNGFVDAEDYYERCANRPFLRRIARPTLILHAQDDPFMDPGIIPAARELAPSVTLELSSGGGHVGFVAAGRLGLPELWLERRIPDYLLERRQAAR